MKKYRGIAVLIGIFLLGAWLRFRGIGQWVWYLNGYDDSRDMLVARHIAVYGEHILRGSMADGSFHLLVNSPVYYDTTALFFAVGRSPLGIMVLWAAVATTSIGLVYAVGKRIWDEATGLVFAVLLAVHPEFVYMGKVYEQTPFLPVIVWITLFLLAGRKPLTYFGFFILAAFLFLPIHFHFGYLIVFPVLLVWLSVRWWNEHRIKTIGAILYPVVVFTAFAAGTVLLTYRVRPFDQAAFVPALLVHRISTYVSLVQTALSVFVGVLFPVIDPFVSYGIMIISVALLYTLIRSKNRRWFFWIFLAAVVPFFIVGFYNSDVHPNYFYSVLAVWLLVFGLAVRKMIEMNRVFGWCFLAGALVLFFIQSVSRSNPQTFVSYYDQQRRVAQAIYADYRRTGVPEQGPLFTLATLSSTPYLWYDGWATGATWYFLEQDFGQQLVRLSDTGANFVPLVSRPVFIYVICDHRENPYAGSACRRRFAGYRTYLSDAYTTVYQTQVYTVWRYSIVRPAPGNQYNIGYPDLAPVR